MERLLLGGDRIGPRQERPARHPDYVFGRRLGRGSDDNWPSRDDFDWRWIGLGSAAASALWVCASLLFSWAMAWLGTLDELYGSVGTMIGFMLWIWLSVTVVLVGAELDASGMEMGKGCGTAR